MIAGEVVIEEFRFGVEKQTLPLVNKVTSVPTGETIDVTDIVIVPMGVDQQSVGLTVRIRFPGDTWQAFLKEVEGRKVDVVPAGALHQLKH